MNRRVIRLASLSLAMVLTVGLLGVSYVCADTLASPHYKMIETSLGNGGLLQSSSAHYQSTQSIGDTAVGTTKSTNYQTQAGSKTTADPSLTFTINSGATSFGSFSPTAAATATSSFSVSNYTSYGYIVQIVGDTPHNGTHVIPGMTTSDVSQPGQEQFGINLVANTAPKSFGANPDQGQFGEGYAEPNYANPNHYMYNSGDTIAAADKTSGITTYTISYIVNVGSLTPGGQYSSHQQLVCTATF